MAAPQVLIVEDRQPLADLYAEWLADTYHVETAYTGREAVSMLDASVDVLLLDRRLPDISGDDVFEISADRGLDCRVAMITAAEPTFETATMGLDDYLTKPVSRATLRETVSALLSNGEDAGSTSAGSTPTASTSAASQSTDSSSAESTPTDASSATSASASPAESAESSTMESTDSSTAGSASSVSPESIATTTELGQSPIDAILQRNGAGDTAATGLTDADGVADTGADEPMIDMERVRNESLPPVVTELIETYDDRLGYRDSRFLLKWLHVVFSFFTLSSVDEEYAEDCRTARTLASLFVMLVDDLGERHDDEVTLTEAAKLPFPNETPDRSVAGIDADYMAVTEAVWDALEPRLRAAPRFDEIESLFYYDMRQVIHAIRYSALVNEHPEIANMSEVRALGAHNMMMLAYADIDVAFSPAFSRTELGELRSLLLELQQMARIGNWVTTWERELDEGDVSAGVFVSAVENGILSAAELSTAASDPSARETVRERLTEAHVEEALIEQWQQRCARLRADPPSIESVDVEALIDGMERVMAYHLASRGLK